MKYNYDFTLDFANKCTRRYTCQNIEARLDFLSNNVTRVSISKKGQRLLPTYSVCPLDTVIDINGRDRLSLDGFDMSSPVVEKIGETQRFTIGRYSIVLNPFNFSLAFYKDNMPLFSDRPFLAYNFDGEFGDGQKHYITRNKDEEIFGLGEKSGNVNKNGKRYIISSTDSMGYDATSTDPLYKHFPFYICRNNNGCYGMFYDTHATSQFDFGCEINNYYGDFKSFSTEDDCLVYYVFLGERVSDITTAFSKLTGRNAFMPKWTLEYCGSTMSYTDAPNADEKLRGFVDKCKQNNIRCKGFFLSSGYTTIKDKRYVFNWDKTKIPQPKSLTKYFADNGINLIANVKPAFLTDHPLYKYIAKNGWFLHYKDGSPAVVPFWAGYGSYLDFTNKGAFDFWSKMVKEQLVDNGIYSTWNDNNEYDITDKSILADCNNNPAPAYLMRSVFSTLMVMASYSAQNDGNRQMLATRSGCAGLNRLAQTWSGDNKTSFVDLKFNHKMAMGMSLSGINNFGHDIGGFAGEKPDRQLFMRWLQYGVFLPRFCIHSWNDDGSTTEPWMYKDLTDNVIDLYKLRKSFIPYLYNAFYNTCERFCPIIAPIFYYFDDFDVESDCFMFGQDIMVANIFDKDVDTVKVDLPENNGGWYRQDNHYACGQYDINNYITDLPVYFIRGGSVIPIDQFDYKSEKQEIIFKVFPLEIGQFKSTFFNDDGVSYAYKNNDCVNVEFDVECQDDTVIVYYKNNGKQKIIPEIKLIDFMQRKLIVTAKDNTL